MLMLTVANTLIVVDEVHTYPLVTGQRQTLGIRRSAQFSLQWLLCACRNPLLRRNFLQSDVLMDSCPPTAITVFSKPASRNNHCKAFCLWTQQRDQCGVESRSRNQGFRKIDAFV